MGIGCVMCLSRSNSTSSLFPQNYNRQSGITNFHPLFRLTVWNACLPAWFPSYEPLPFVCSSWNDYNTVDLGLFLVSHTRSPRADLSAVLVPRVRISRQPFFLTERSLLMNAISDNFGSRVVDACKHSSSNTSSSGTVAAAAPPTH